MKNRKTQLPFLVFLSIFTLFGALSVSGQKIIVDNVPSTQVPVKIVSSWAKVTKGGLKINYSLFSYHTQELSSVKLFAFRVDETGRIKGGFALNEEKLAVGSPKSNTHFLKGDFSKGERIVLVPIKARIQSVQGFAEASANLSNLSVSVKNYLKKGVLPVETNLAGTTTADFVPVSDPATEEGTCDVATIAVTVCGKGCVKSVDCKNEAFVCKDTCSGLLD